MMWVEWARILCEGLLAIAACAAIFKLRHPPRMMSDTQKFVSERAVNALQADIVTAAERNVMMLGHAIRHNKPDQIQRFGRRLMKAGIDPPETPEGCDYMARVMRERRG